MAVDSWLCFVSRRKIFGINLRNPLKSPNSWSCLPTPNFDFYSTLPSPAMCPFVFDSNIYMASGDVDPKLYSLDFPLQFPPNTVYEFRIHSDKKRKQLQSGETHQQLQPGEPQPGEPLFSPLLDSFSPTPMPFLDSYLTNISGDVYLYVDPTRKFNAPESIYVLRSGSKEWKPLPPPPLPSSPPREDEEEDSWGIHPSGMFVLHGKLFLASTRIGSPYLVSFNPGEQSWMVETEGEKEKKNVSWLSFHSMWWYLLPDLDHMPESDYMRNFEEFSIPYISVILQDPSLRKHSIAFSRSFHPCIRELDRPTTAYIKLTALLLNQNGGVMSYQHLDQCFEGIQPKIHTFRFHLVDLGQGKLCAVLYGSAMENAFSPVLCISIFTPSLVEDFAALHTDSSPLVKEQTFLSLTVHSKSVYNMEDWCTDAIHHAFVWPPPKEGSFHHRTTIE